MCGPQSIDIEKEEYLTELLVDLYDRWKSCANTCGTEDENKETFFEGIRRHLEKGFSILSEPGIYHDEDELENLSNDLYGKWKDYMQGVIDDMGIDDDEIDTTVGTFIAIAKTQLKCARKKRDPVTSWQDTEIKPDD